MDEMIGGRCKRCGNMTVYARLFRCGRWGMVCEPCYMQLTDSNTKMPEGN